VSTFCGELLPTHPYYKSSRSDLKLLRTENITNLNNVVSTLELIVELMDEEELKREEEEKQRKLEMEKAARENLLLRTQNLKVHHTSGKKNLSKEELQLTAEEKLRLLMRGRGPKADEAIVKKEEDPKPKPEPVSVPSNVDESKTLEEDTPISSLENSLSNISVLPAPIPVPPPNESRNSKPSPWDPVVEPSQETSQVAAPTPPSYDFAVNLNQSQQDLPSKGSSIPSTNPMYNNDDGLQKSGSWLNESSRSKDKKRSSPEDSAMPVKELRSAYKQEREFLKRQKKASSIYFLDLLPILHFFLTCYLLVSNCSVFEYGKVETFFLSTYQGRSRAPGKNSTNGCTVISPLIAINYLCSSSSGMSDNSIEEVIDNKAPPILSAVRRKLGLPGEALIIPSDVHDYLVDLKLLRQDMFVGVCGGNILNPNHLGIFLNMLKNGSSEEAEEKKNSTRKVAAALFFHEHVVSILKLNMSNGDCWFDLVDSMPKSREGGRMGGTRTRCKDINALEVVLREYACSKFSESNCMYIDNNLWDDILCDFDPRVFQAFVWAA